MSSLIIDRPGSTDLEELFGLKGTITPTFNYKPVLPSLPIDWGQRGPFEWKTDRLMKADGAHLSFRNGPQRHPFFLSGTKFLEPGDTIVITIYWKDSSGL